MRLFRRSCLVVGVAVSMSVLGVVPLSAVASSAGQAPGEARAGRDWRSEHIRPAGSGSYCRHSHRDRGHTRSGGERYDHRHFKIRGSAGCPMLRRRWC